MQFAIALCTDFYNSQKYGGAEDRSAVRSKYGGAGDRSAVRSKYLKVA